MLLRRAEETAGGKGSAASVVGVGDLFPATGEFLTCKLWDDGKARRTGTVMVVCEDGKWKAWLHDRDGRRSAWVTANDAATLLQVAEEALLTGAADWRADKK